MQAAKNAPEPVKEVAEKAIEAPQPDKPAEVPAPDPLEPKTDPAPPATKPVQAAAQVGLFDSLASFESEGGQYKTESMSHAQ